MGLSSQVTDLSVWDTDLGTNATKVTKLRGTFDVHDAQTVLAGDRLFIFQGRQLWSYSTATKILAKETSAPEVRFDGQIAAVGNRIYLVGGSRQRVMENLPTLIYDAGTKQWSEGAAPPEIVLLGTAVGAAGKVYLFGGLNEGEKVTDRLFVYDPAADSWSTGPAMPDKRAWQASISDGKAVYLLGGRYWRIRPEDGAVLEESEPVAVWRFDPAKATYGALSNLPFGGTQMRAALAEGRFYVNLVNQTKLKDFVSYRSEK